MLIDAPARKWARALLILSLAPPVLIVCKILLDGVDLPFFDEYFPGSSVDVALAAAEHRLKFADLLSQNFEHRIFFTNLTTAALARFSHWDLRAEMFLSVALAAAAGALMLSMLRQRLPMSWMLGALPISLLLFSLRQQNNWLWGLESAWYFALFFLTAEAFLVLRMPENPLAAPLAALCGACALFSFGAGILALPLGFAAVLFRRRWKVRDLAAWVLVGAASLAAFFFHYVRGPAARLAPDRIPRIALFIVTYLGGVFVKDEGSPIWIAALGGTLALALFLGAALLCLRREREQDLSTIIPWLILGGYSLSSGVLVSLSTRGEQLSNALFGRYVTNGSLLTLAAVPLSLIALAPGPVQERASPPSGLERAGFAFGWTALFAAFAMASVQAWGRPRFTATRTQQECAIRLLQTSELCFDPTIPYPARVAHLLPRLALHRLTVFKPLSAWTLKPSHALVLDPANTDDWALSTGMERSAQEPTLFRISQSGSMLYRPPLDLDLAEIAAIEVTASGSGRSDQTKLQLQYGLNEGLLDRNVRLAPEPGREGIYLVPVELILGSARNGHLRGLRIDLVGNGPASMSRQVRISRIAFILRG